jgi:hypothetical protein
VPQAPASHDALAKQFITHPDTATLYIYRPDRSPGWDNIEDTVLYLDERLIGASLPGTYFRLDLRPGVYQLHGLAHDNGNLKVEIRSGETTFVSMTVFGGSSYFRRVNEATGKRELTACCALLENWKPDQRPLLR